MQIVFPRQYSLRSETSHVHAPTKSHKSSIIQVVFSEYLLDRPPPNFDRHECRRLKNIVQNIQDNTFNNAVVSSPGRNCHSNCASKFVGFQACGHRDLRSVEILPTGAQAWRKLRA